MLKRNKFINFNKFFNIFLLASGLFTGRLIFNHQNNQTSTTKVTKNNNQVNLTLKAEEARLLTETINNEVWITGIDNWQTCTNVTIPENVVGIKGSNIPDKWGAFWKCNFSSIDFSKAKKLKTIGDYAFKECANLQSINIKSGVDLTVGNSAFDECNSLNTVILGSHVVSLMDNCFGFLPIQNLTLNEGLKYIGRSAFYLTQIQGTLIIPNSVTTIEQAAFYNCNEIEDIRFGSGLEAISARCFFDCNGLRNLNIPANINSIDFQAFASCSILETVYFDNPTIDFRSNVFYECNELHNVILQPSDLTYADNSKRNELVNYFQPKFNQSNVNISTWYDSPTERRNVNFYEFDGTYFSLNDGYKNYVTTHPGASISVSFNPNNVIELGASVDLNRQLSRRIRVNVVRKIQPDYLSSSIVVNPKVTLTNQQEQLNKTFVFNPITFLFDANNTHTASTPVYTKSQIKDHDGDGLWVGGDFVTSTLTIDAAFFREKWKDQNFIQQNINEYLKFVDANGNDLYLVRSGAQSFFNDQLGQVEVTNITLTGANNNLYEIGLKIEIPNLPIMNLFDQDIAIKLNNRSYTDNLLTIHTFSGHHFDPNDYSILPPTSIVNIPGDQSQANFQFNLTKSQKFQYLEPNSFKFLADQNPAWKFSIDTSNFNNEYISINNQTTLNNDGAYFTNTINVKKVAVFGETIHVNGLKLIASKQGETSKEFDLPAFDVKLNAYEDLRVITKPVLAKNPKIDNRRNGLWMPEDSYSATIQVNKQYFGDYANNKKLIQENFDQFFAAYNLRREKYSWTEHAGGSNLYFNPFVGDMKVINVTDFDQKYYNIDLVFSTPNRQLSYLTQDIDFKINGASKILFSIHTIAPSDFDVQYLKLSNEGNNTINLTHDHREGLAVYQTSDQNQWINLNGNTLKWAKANGYKLVIDKNGFASDYITIGETANFDSNQNILSFDVKQIKPIIENEKTIYVQDLRLKIIDNNGQTLRNFSLAYFKVILALANKNVTSQNYQYTTSSSNDSLAQENDLVNFNLLVPNVLIQDLSSTADLINLLNFHYETTSNRWQWIAQKSLNNEVYKFISNDQKNKYELTYYKITTLNSNINPIIEFHVTLKQLFNSDKQDKIVMNFDHATSSDVTIKTNKYIPTPTPSPLPFGQIILKWLPVIGGSVGGLIILIIMGIIIYRKRRFNKYLSDKYLSKRK